MEIFQREQCCDEYNNENKIFILSLMKKTLPMNQYNEHSIQEMWGNVTVVYAHCKAAFNEC